MIQAIVLAGGKSERMGCNKMLLPYKKSTVLKHNIQLLLEIVNEVVVVTGKYHSEIEAYIKKEFHKSPVQVIENKGFEKGMFSSVQVGVNHTKGDIVLVPGDSAFYEADTVRTLLNSTGDFIVPSYKKRGGHPIVIRASLREALLTEPSTSNLKLFRNKQQVNWVEVNDPGVLIDIDTKEDYDRITKK